MYDETLRKLKALGGEGILNEKDLSELNDAVFRVMMLMADGQWHRAEDIRAAAGKNGDPASEGLRRMRELRNFFEIEKARDSEDSRQFAYRLRFKKALVPEPAAARPGEGRLF